MESLSAQYPDITGALTLGLNSTANTTSYIDKEIPPTRYYYILMLLIVPIVGLVGNTMVIIAVKTVRVLQNDTNKILCSLATADLLVCLLVMPPSAAQLATGSWKLGAISCSLFLFLDVCLCTASIMHICAISVERCIGVVFPLANRACHRRCMILVTKLVVVWTYSISTALPVLVFAYQDKETISVGSRCVLNNLNFQIYGSFLAFYIPVGVMTVAHFLTTRILVRQHRLHKNTSGKCTLRRVQGFKIPKLPNHKQEEESFNTSFGTNSEFQTINEENEVNENQCNEGSRTTTESNRVSRVSGFQESRLLSSCSINIIEARKMYIGIRLSQCEIHGPSIPRNFHSLSPSSTRTKPTNIKKPIKRHTMKKLRRRASRFVDIRNKLKDKHMQDGSVSRELKASKVLKLVFIAFLVCWSPFFVLNITSAICANKCTGPPAIIDIAVWLGYCSSIVNPMIYTIINKEFQHAFKSILMCKLCLWTKRSKMDRMNSASIGGSFRDNRKNAILVTNYCNGTHRHVIERIEFRNGINIRPAE